MGKLSASIRSVRGIGPKKAAILERLGIHTLQDALLFYPREYEDRTKIIPIGQLSPTDAHEKCCICAVIGTAPQHSHIRQGMDITKLRVFDPSGVLQIVYFNNKYAAAQLRAGETYLFFGAVQKNGKHLQMISPAHEKCRDDAPNGRICPVYPLSAGITQRDIRQIVHTALQHIDTAIPDPLPQDMREKYAFPSLAESLQNIHQPPCMADAETARRRFIYEELFVLCCGLAYLKTRRQAERGIQFLDINLSPFWKQLGFPPTAAQRRVVDDILQDVTGGHPMNRLVQGDVGSGKTAIAAALCALAIQNGFQAAVMAPTEILAAQHYETFQRIFAPLGVQIRLLSGSLSAGQKRAIKAQIADGSVHLIIGTHALIQQDVTFRQLGAVVVDEQHRFGVQQRALLSAKGQLPHVLVMSATPIPRTLALLVYAELEVSVLDELPPGRAPVETYAVGEPMRTRIYRFIEKQCQDSGQVYVVCPLVQKGELDLKNASDHAADLQQHFPRRKIGLMHGKMRQSEKDAVMQQFAAGTIDILVSTTVIEVGVNVPNATLMVVEDAQRFGLSQLHQLRGRVGRGKRQSYCIFFGVDQGAQARERLQLLSQTSDGFAIAKADLQQRGPGDFFGNRQHGLPQLHIADMLSDVQWLQNAQQDAAQLLQKTTDFSAFPVLREAIERLFRKQDETGFFN